MTNTIRTNDQLVETFAKGIKSHGKINSLFFEYDTLYSYGYHYPLAMHINHNAVLINDIGYSVTTSKHIGLAISNTLDKKQVFLSECSVKIVLNRMQELEAKLTKARKPQIYTEQIQRLYSLFIDNVQYLKGFYEIEVNRGYFGTNSNIKFINVLPQNLLSITEAKDINRIYNNSFKY